MEADWEVEVGNGAPVIEALWPGFVDLRVAPHQAHRLPEVGQLPALARVLVMLNAPRSSVWTSRCDVWRLEDFDPDEMDAPRDVALHAVACYIDLLPRRGLQWSEPTMAADWSKLLCTHLHAISLRSCRADCVIRSAVVDPERLEFGVTAYLSAAGSDSAAASQTLALALAAFADSVPHAGPPERSASKLQ